MATIFIVDDDQAIGEMLSLVLENEGFQTVTCLDGLRAVEMFPIVKPDLILLDVMLPGLDGTGVARRIRATSNVPIIMLTAKSDTLDVVAGLEAGADDYVPKPFKVAELLARIRSVLRRGRSGGDLSLSLGNVSLWPEGRRVEVDGRELALLKKEFDILLYFMQRPNHLVDKAVLAEAVWGDHADDADNFHFVYAQMKNLRRKLAEAGATVELKSVYGFGYKLSLPQSE